MGTDLFHLLGTCLDGKFRVDKFVAEGGFAVVYSGQHLSLDRAIAIKVLKTPAELNELAREQFISKFRLEAQTIARLSHLNIVQVIDYGVSLMPSGERAPWMVLEWLTGRTLEQDLQRRRGQGGRSPEQALELLEPIFDALAYAHEEGIAHRDVKPGNIMIVPTKRGEMLKLLDFGIVKIMDKGETAETNLAPTRGILSAHSPAYAAPEQITGLRTGPWTDVHALALLLTEVMTDLPPYDGKNITTLLRDILSPQRPTPARRRIDAGPWEAVLTKALALEPVERFKDASELLAALKSAVPRALKPIAGKAESKEDFAITQRLPPARSSARPAPPASAAETPKLQRDAARSSPKAPPSNSAIPQAFRGSSGTGLSRKVAWSAAVSALVLLALGGGYLATRGGSGDKPPRPSMQPSAEGRRPVPANPSSPPKLPPIPPATASATTSPSSAIEPSRQASPNPGTKELAAGSDVRSDGPVTSPPSSTHSTSPVELSATSSEPRREDQLGTGGPDAGIGGAPGLKAQTRDQPAPGKRARSPGSKPLQRTKIEIE